MIIEMSPGEIKEFVRSQKVGRVGCHLEGETYVVPVIYGWDADCIYVYTTEGKKVDMMRENRRVCFEIDEYLTNGAWRSGIAQGEVEELEGEVEWQHAVAELHRCGNPRRRLQHQCCLRRQPQCL